MACASISGISQSCLSNLGGIQKIYITNFENITGTTSNGIGTLTDIDMSGSSKFQEFEFVTVKSTSTFSEEATVTLENSSVFYVQTTTLVIGRKESSKRQKILLLAQGNPKLAIIIQDNNGAYWFSGFQNGAYLSTNVASHGTAKTDLNGYTITFVAEEPSMANEIDSAVIPTII